MRTKPPHDPGTRPASLRVLRGLIDGVDDSLVLMLAARRRLAGIAANRKQAVGLPLRDPGREERIRARARSLASRVGVSEDTATAVIDAALASTPHAPSPPHVGAAPAATALPGRHLLRLIPPPQRLAPALRLLPESLQARFLEAAMARVLAAPLAEDTLAFLQGRRLGIDVTDLDLHWVIGLAGDRLALVAGTPEASVRGTATDLLLLAARMEDADTLFFQRRLVLTGKTELGLAARNLLEGLPWESVPLGLRIGLDRGARFARAAREARSAGRDRDPRGAAAA